MARQWLEDVSYVIFPTLCPGCSSPLSDTSRSICLKCHLHLPMTHFHTDTANAMNRAFHGRLKLVHAMAMLYFKKHSITRDLLHHIKYHQGKELAYDLGQIYGSILCSYPLTRPDLLAPVPLHHTKLKKRGFNQSSAFALGVGNAWNVAVDDSILQKKVATNTQTKMGRWVRWKNVADVFEVSEPESVYGKHIMVVDDVMTTGSTLEACGQSLRATGCESLSVMTLAYTQQ